MKDRERQGDIITLFGALIWSLFPVITVLSYSGASPLVSLGWSVIFSFIFFAIVVALRGRWAELVNKKALPDIIRTTLLNGILYYILYFSALKFTSAGNASIIALTEVLFGFLLFNVWRKEYFSPRHIMGALLMVLGAVIVLLPNFTEFHPGDLLILAASAVGPFGNLFQKRARTKVSSETMMFVRSAIAGPAVLLLALIFGHGASIVLPPHALFVIALNGLFVLGLSKILWIEGIHRISITKANALSSIAPLFTLLFAWLFLHQAPLASQLYGFFPIFFGVILLGTNKKQMLVELESP